MLDYGRRLDELSAACRHLHHVARQNRGEQSIASRSAKTALNRADCTADKDIRSKNRRRAGGIEPAVDLPHSRSRPIRSVSLLAAEALVAVIIRKSASADRPPLSVGF